MKRTCTQLEQKKYGPCCYAGLDSVNLLQRDFLHECMVFQDKLTGKYGQVISTGILINHTLTVLLFVYSLYRTAVSPWLFCCLRKGGIWKDPKKY